jgi:hypothetical protein
MSFVQIMKKIGLIAGVTAPQVITMVNPSMGAIANTVLQSVLLAEARIGPGNGDQKKEDALAAMQIAMPAILQLVAISANKQLADPAQLSSGIEKLNDGFVDVLNAFRVLPKE